LEVEGIGELRGVVVMMHPLVTPEEIVFISFSPL